VTDIQKIAKKNGYTTKPLNTVCITAEACKILITTFSHVSGSINSKMSLFSFGNSLSIISFIVMHKAANYKTSNRK